MMTAPDQPSDAPIVQGAKVDPQVVQKKLERYFELCELSMELALEGIRYRHPEADRAELLRLFAERLAVFRKDKWQRNG